MSARWLLDTCVVSEQVRPRPEPRVQAWLQEKLAQCAFTAVTFGEISFGIELLPRGHRRDELVRWAAALRDEAQARTLAADSAVWIAYGRLKASLRAIGRPQDALDLIIAATALVHDLTLITRNSRHFQDTGVRLLDPWNEPI